MAAVSFHYEAFKVDRAAFRRRGWLWVRVMCLGTENILLSSESSKHVVLSVHFLSPKMVLP